MQKLNLADLQKAAVVLDANNISLYDFKVNISYDTDLANLYFNDFEKGHMSGNIEVFKNGSLIDDFHLCELANFDEYDSYDKDKLITMIKDYCSDKDYKDLLVAHLDKNLNDTIDYDY